MFVHKSMSQQIVSIHRDTRIIEAQQIMKDHHIRHLPVVEEDRTLIGMVTDRDIRSAMPSVFQEDFNSREVRERMAALRAEDIMTRDVVTVMPMHTIQDVLLLMQESKFGAFPVVDKDGKLRGIISMQDLVRAFINVLGIGEPGTLLGILVPEEVGQLKRIADAVTEENISFGSVLVARYWDESKRAVFIYLMTNNVIRIKRKLISMGYSLLDPMDWNLDSLPETARPDGSLPEK